MDKAVHDQRHLIQLLFRSTSNTNCLQLLSLLFQLPDMLACIYGHIFIDAADVNQQLYSLCGTRLALLSSLCCSALS